MLDKVISLSLDSMDKGGGAGAVEVEIASSTPARQWQPRLRLWNALGREPIEPLRQDGAHRWHLGPADSLRGCTFTWSVRVAPDAQGQPPHFELRLRLLLDRVPLEGGEFFYSGPLEGLEERAGRFHFRSPPKPSA